MQRARGANFGWFRHGFCGGGGDDGEEVYDREGNWVWDVESRLVAPSPLIYNKKIDECLEPCEKQEWNYEYDEVNEMKEVG